jgi:prepilin-type N-terminal cleavage/methylation domain-containing protein/prepilin-type processing-associated H-X9-DG protein
MQKKFLQKNGFTLIELLVVVAIIGVLISILLPALSNARALSRATMSMSNMKQWGLGTTMYAQNNNDFFPWEGNKLDINECFPDPMWWANAIPPYVNQKTYLQISNDAYASGKNVPLPPDQSSIFVDPSAKVPNTPGNEFPIDYRDNYGRQYFFCYIWSSELNNGNPPAGIPKDFKNLKVDQIELPAVTVVMLEKRTIQDELPNTNDRIDRQYYNEDLTRHRGDWKRFAARHRNGGHIVFADGHAAHFTNNYVTTNSSGSRDQRTLNGDWNKPDIIWNPRGPAIN